MISENLFIFDLMKYTSEDEDYDYDSLNRKALETDFKAIIRHRRRLSYTEFDILGIKPIRDFKEEIEIDNLTNKQLMLFIECDDEKKRMAKKHRRVSIRGDRSKRNKRQPKHRNKKKVKSSHKKAYDKYIDSDQWTMMRWGLFYKRGEKCERCGKTENLQVHHKTYENLFREKFADLEILCKECHRKEHGLS